jgi:coenzyme F420-reducing hydrogenase beta subunit
VNICPKQCIAIIQNDEGFYYPEINKMGCINCEKCANVCPIDNAKYNVKPRRITTFQNDNLIRNESTSGGFFSRISDYILENNGIVYGAAFDSSFAVKHTKADNEQSRNAMRHSKYVQSYLGDSFKAVRSDLNNGVIVLFTGTPCQVAGVINYLNGSKVDMQNLITCDFVCHGTPSPLMWSEYLKFIAKKYNDEIIDVNFRDKSIGWHKPQLKIQMNKKTYAGTEAQDSFYQMFYSNCILRLSCHTCPYSNVRRVADITMGDSWGVEYSRPELDDDRGLSLLLVNSDKGMKTIEKMNLNLNDIELKDLRQPHLYRPANISRKRSQFWEEYRYKGFKFVLSKYGNYTLYRKLIKKSKKLILKALNR